MADRTICPHFLRGRCKFGDRCKFEHSHPRRQVCSYFMNGRCKFGDRCKFEHPSAPAAQNQVYVGETTHAVKYIHQACVYTRLSRVCRILYRFWEDPKAPRRPLLLEEAIPTTQRKDDCACGSMRTGSCVWSGLAQTNMWISVQFMSRR